MHKLCPSLSLIKNVWYDTSFISVGVDEWFASHDLKNNNVSKGCYYLTVSDINCWLFLLSIHMDIFPLTIIFLLFLGKRTRASQYTKKKDAVAPKSRSGRRDNETSSTSSSNRYKTNKDSKFQPVSDIGVLNFQW